MSSAGTSARAIIDKVPWLKNLARPVWRFFRNIFSNQNIKHDFSDAETVEVPMAFIKKYMLNDFQYDKKMERNSVLGGDWDQQTEDINNIHTFIALKQNINEGIKWQDTNYFKTTMKQINVGKTKWGCENEEQFLEHCERFKKLYETIKKEGYKKQVDLAANVDELKSWDEISLFINRKGEYLFHDGRHRLSCAKLLGLEKIPAQILARHSQWEEFRNEVYAYAMQSDGKVYAPILHPDFSHIPSHHGHERYEMMKNSITVSSGRVLDIGCHWGYFCHRFKQDGFECYAVENIDQNIYFLKKFNEILAANFTVLDQSIFEPLPHNNYEIILALNIFHHFLKTEELYQKLLDFLDRVKTNIIFLGTHRDDEPQMKESYKNFDPNQFADFISEKASLPNQEYLGTSKDGRKLFKLYR